MRKPKTSRRSVLQPETAPPIEIDEHPTALYRLYGGNDDLLYVGIADAPKARWKQHAKDKPWWGSVHRKTVQWFPSRSLAETAEKAAITTERPRHNVLHVPKPPKPPNLPKPRSPHPVDRHTTRGGVYARPSPELRKQIKPALQGHDWTVNDVLVACLTRLVKDPAGTLEWLAGDKPTPKKGRPSKQG